MNRLYDADCQAIDGPTQLLAVNGTYPPGA
jgi:hypothetical protein